MSDIKHRFVKANGIKMHVAEAGEGYPVVMCHGFPELWYSWRHQLRALADAGFRAIAPDQRGYGDTDRPEPIDAYTQRKLVGDIVGMLDALAIGRCTIIGHDWGGAVAWNAALMAPESIERVIGINTPFLPRAPKPPTELMREMAAGNFHYILYFQQPGVAEAELERDVYRTLARLLPGARRFRCRATQQRAARSVRPRRRRPARSFRRSSAREISERRGLRCVRARVQEDRLSRRPQLVS